MRRSLIAITLAAAGIGAVQPALAASWTVDNQTSLQIFRLFVSPCGNDMWGPNLLASGILEPGKSHVVQNLTGTCHEAKLVDEDGDVCVVAVRGETLAVTKAFLIKCQGHQGSAYSPLP
jgi:hypothetical protein